MGTGLIEAEGFTDSGRMAETSLRGASELKSGQRLGALF